MTIEALRTPDERFANLPGFDYEPNYIDDLEGYEGLRMHYVDEGQGDVTFLCLHGEPSWSYLYRKMIPVFTAAGHRAVAPDFLGFGRSDKPTKRSDYSFHFHRNMLLRFIERLDLKNVCLVVQDWGGLLGLTLPMTFPDRINRMIVMNTALAVGLPAGKGFNQWRQYVIDNPDFDIPKLFKRSEPTLTDEEAAAYDAPFPDASYRAGVVEFPQMVMTDPEMEGVKESMAAGQFFGTEWSGQTFMAIGMTDPVLGPKVMKMLHGVIKGCNEPMEVENAGHFVQEQGGPVAEAALAYFGL